jgi:uncharacterized delta-60 repeat protein
MKTDLGALPKHQSPRRPTPLSTLRRAALGLCGALLASSLSLAQTVDTGFGNHGGYFGFNRIDHDETVQDIERDSQGRILLAFQIEDATAPGTWWPSVLRLLPDGSADLSFGFLGVWTENTTASISEFLPVRIAVDSLDRPLVGWTHSFPQGAFTNEDIAVRRLTTTGISDLFVSGGLDINIATGYIADRLGDLLVLPGDQVVAVAEASRSAFDTDFGFLKWVPTGTDGLVLDTNFDADGRRILWFDLGSIGKSDRPTRLLYDGGNLVATGYASTDAGYNVVVCRISALGGQNDISFGTGGLAVHQYSDILTGPWPRQIATSIARASGGGYVLAGNADDGSLLHMALLKIQENGALDTGWNGAGWWLSLSGYPGQLAQAEGFLQDLAVDVDGSVTAAGIAFHPLTSGESRAVVVRRTSTGLADTGFSPNGLRTYAFEPNGEPTASHFNALRLIETSLLEPATQAIFAGGMFGLDAGTSRTDLDIMATRINISGSLFFDGFESGSTSAWSSTTP